MVYGHFGIGIVLFVFFLTIDVILYAFNAAIRTLSPNDIAESKEGKAKYREMISKILESPSRFNDTVNIIVYITNIIAGSYILGSLARRVIQSVNGDKTWVYIVLAVAMILVFIIFGVIIPEKTCKVRTFSYACAFTGCFCYNHDCKRNLKNFWH